MREVNFSVPASNKAAVGITTALYDRRALDCTSTLPLINSLNHLAYLTTSSARIREILTVDGGVEKLVSILKYGRTKDMMDTWKWNLAFQCVVNVGVRGSDGKASDNRSSENIRTRVVEADIVPVVATILDNYMQVVERIRARSDEIDARSSNRHATSSRRVRFGEERASSRRRDAPPPIAIPVSVEEPTAAVDSESDQMDITIDAPSETEAGPSNRLSVDADRRLFSASRATPDHEREASVLRARSPRSDQPRLRASTWAASDTTLRTRDGTLLPFIRGRADFSQPQTPTTPTGPTRAAEPTNSTSSSRRTSASPVGRVAIQRQPSPMDERPETAASVDVDAPMERGSREEPRIENDIMMPDLPERAAVLETARQDDGFATNIGESEADAFNLTPTGMDGSILDPSATPTQRTIGFAAPEQAPFPATQPTPELNSPAFLSRLSLERTSSTPHGALVSVPRDEDVIMSLQLLAYVSKYCHLRSYFQQSHLVPKLRIGGELDALDGTARSPDEAEEDDNDSEFCQPDDYNIFPLVEKFTMRNHSPDMKYWAGVVMRNLCRKDKSQGDIRQCAYYQCGKWEKYARQFAKCRRCRQTKYCSKECQKSAWYVGLRAALTWTVANESALSRIQHRHWCQPCNSS